MSIPISTIFQGIGNRQLPALITILGKAQEFAANSGIEQQTLLAARLYPDMHPLSWQLQTTLELVARGGARLCGDEPASLVLDEDNFSAIIARIETVQAELAAMDSDALDQSAGKTFEIPIGPDAKLSLTGSGYVLGFLLPNFYFHLTTVYDLLRMSGVPLGKRDYMGPMQ